MSIEMQTGGAGYCYQPRKENTKAGLRPEPRADLMEYHYIEWPIACVRCVVQGSRNCDAVPSNNSLDSASLSDAVARSVSEGTSWVQSIAHASGFKNAWISPKVAMSD